MSHTAESIQQVIDALDYRFEDFDLDHFLNHLECMRRREIFVLPAPFSSPGISGLWIKAGTADYVFYVANSHPIYKVHSVLHEIGHILLGHACRHVEDVLPAELIEEIGQQSLVGRLRFVSSPMTDEEEQECELFVALFQRKIVRANRLHTLTGAQSSIPAFKRYIQSGA